jgi:hypothetical protein
MPKWIKRLWNDPVWSKVIAAGILGIPGAIHYRNIIWPTPLWVLALLVGLVLALTYAAILRPRLAAISSEIGKSLLSSKLQSSNSGSKLIIHSAKYQAPNGAPYDVTEFLRQMITGDSLVFQIENHNFVIGDENYVPKDPAPFLPKLLEVQYSFDRSPIYSMERPEHSRLVLPEDTFLKGQESLSRDTIRRLEAQHKSDLWRAQEGRQHCEEERRKALQRIEGLEADTIDRERPEIFVTLIFGPGTDGIGSIGLQNCGTRDAINVQIHPIQIENKRLTFPAIARIPRQEFPIYPQWRVNDVVSVEQEGELAFYLPVWCQKLSIDRLEFTLSATWSDSRGNEFRSTSQAEYDCGQNKCRTKLGPVERIKPSPP